MAAGDDGVAAELQRRLENLGHVTAVRDYLGALPFRLGYLIRFLYATQLQVAPVTYEAVYQLTARFRLAYFVAHRIALLGCSRVSRWARGYDVIVATYPMAGQALGHLRRLGLPAKVIIFLTDFAVHPLWVNRYADLHLTLAQAPAEQIMSIEPLARVKVAGAVVRPEFIDVCTKTMPPEVPIGHTEPDGRHPLVLLVAGSWGVGRVGIVAKELVDHGFPMPVIACGGNRHLYRKLKRKRLGVVLGWVDDMASVMEATDVLVHNAGGLMSIEALAAGLPVIGYRCLPGHGCANAEAMTRAGVAMHACSEGSVIDALRGLNVSTAMDLNSRARELFLTDPALIISKISEQRK